MSGTGQQFIWNGFTGNWLNPADWSPAGYPLYDSGESGVIGSGFVELRNAEPNGIVLTLGGTGANTPTLALNNAAIGPSMVVSVVSSASGDSEFGRLRVSGWDTNYGTIDVISTSASRVSTGIVIDIDPGSQFNQEGTINITTANLSLGVATFVSEGSGGILNNNGQINLNNASAEIFTDITGSGTVALNGGDYQINAVEAPQHVSLTGGNLFMNFPADFHATISDWRSGGGTIVTGLTGPAGGGAAASLEYNQTSPDGGILSLFNASGNRLGDISLAGNYTTESFSIGSYHGSPNDSTIAVI